MPRGSADVCVRAVPLARWSLSGRGWALALQEDLFALHVCVSLRAHAFRFAPCECRGLGKAGHPPNQAKKSSLSPAPSFIVVIVRVTRMAVVVIITIILTTTLVSMFAITVATAIVVIHSQPFPAPVRGLRLRPRRGGSFGPWGNVPPLPRLPLAPATATPCMRRSRTASTFGCRVGGARIHQEPTTMERSRHKGLRRKLPLI